MSQCNKVLITGSLGYIGSCLSAYLIKRGYQVSGIDTGFFKDCLFYDELDRGEFTFADVRTLKAEDLTSFDAVIHLAGISNDPFGDLMPEQVYDSSTQYSIEIAKWCKAQKTKFIFASSCSIYGNALEPVTNEKSKPNPQTFYSFNKMDIETAVGALADEQFQPIFLRFATLLGPSPRMRFDIVVNMFTAMAYCNKSIVLNSDGMATRPFVHIDDVCQSFLCALQHKQHNDQALILNVGQDSENYRILDVAQMVSDSVTGCQLTTLSSVTNEADKELFKDRKLQDGVDSRDYRVSFSKIKEVFPQFEAQWSLKAGIEDLVARYQRLSLNSAQFKSIKYYRLQQMDHLYATQQINNELHWTLKSA